MRDRVARDVGRPEEGEAHDVVPVDVGHEDVHYPRRRRAVPGDALAERARAPLPRSHSTYWLPPASSSTHDECPPKVWAPASPARRSTNALAGPARSSRTSSPRAWTSAWAELVADVGGGLPAPTGMEPRVPQKRIFFRLLLLRRFIGRTPCSVDTALSASPSAHRRKHLEYQVEVADLEDLLRPWAAGRPRRCGKCWVLAWRGGEHEAAQSDAG